MKKNTLSKVLTGECPFLSRTLPLAVSSIFFLSSTGGAQTHEVPAVSTNSNITALPMATAASSSQLTLFQLNILKGQFLQYASSISTLDPSKIATGTQSIDPTQIKDLSQESTTPEEMKVLEAWGLDIDAGTLDQKIKLLFAKAKASNTPIAKQLENLTEAQTKYAIGTLKASIEAVVKLRGLTHDSRGTMYKEWQDLSELMTKKVEISKDFSEAEFLQTEQAEILINGPESFARRDKFMADATESINIMTW